jgi:hypothetical protein
VSSRLHTTPAHHREIHLQQSEDPSWFASLLLGCKISNNLVE